MPHLSDFAGSPLLPASYVRLALIGLAIVLISIYVFVHHKHKHFQDRLKSLLIATVVILSLILLVIGVALGFVLIPKPNIVTAVPATASQNVDTKSFVEIQFDHPVSRRLMEKSIEPEVPGVWIFEDPVYATHLYRKLVFYPDVTLNSNTNYTVKLANITNTLGVSSTYDFNYSFTTKKDPVAAKQVIEEKKATVKLSVPVYLQQHTLSCEIASLRMALAYIGVQKSEGELLAQVGFDNTPHIGGTWGDPYEHFVGNVDGNQMRDGYGVYWGPIERVAKMYGGAQAFQNGSISELTGNILKGNPVIIWVYSSNGTPTHWKTPSGKEIFAVAGEHTVVAVGFVGEASNPTQIIVNDSLVGQVYWPRSFFDRKWATFSQSGVIVFK